MFSVPGLDEGVAHLPLQPLISNCLNQISPTLFITQPPKTTTKSPRSKRLGRRAPPTLLGLAQRSLCQVAHELRYAAWEDPQTCLLGACCRAEAQLPENASGLESMGGNALVFGLC